MVVARIADRQERELEESNKTLGAAERWKVEPHLIRSPSRRRRSDELGQGRSPVPAGLVARTTAHTLPRRPLTKPAKDIKGESCPVRECIKNVKAYLQRPTDDKDVVTAVRRTSPD